MSKLRKKNENNYFFLSFPPGGKDGTGRRERWAPFKINCFSTRILNKSQIFTQETLFQHLSNILICLIPYYVTENEFLSKKKKKNRSLFE